MMPRRHLDIEALRALVCIVDTASFSVAAQQLGRTQSATSLQIKRLEQTVGQTLLRRVQGRVDGPTAEGTALLAYARQILRLNDEAYATVAQDAVAGTLRVGLPEELMESVFPALMPHFRAQYPRLRLVVHADTSAALRRMLADGGLDLALYKHCGDEAPSAGEVLWQEALIWMAGVSYRDSPSALADGALPLALFGENCVFRLAATAALAQAGTPWLLQYSGSSTTGLCHAVRCGLGLTALPRSLLGVGMVELTAVDGKPLPPLPAARFLAEHAPGAVTTVAQRFVAMVGEAMARRVGN
ncbi:MAG: LysR family transcriptional regulator [Dechloromonas sp.]|nr:LysR family transcriptional regulator [Dechloromonas sp.]